MNVKLFYAYRIVSRLYFHLPVIFVFLYLHGSDLFTVELLIAVYAMTLALTAPLAPVLATRLPLKIVIGGGEIAKAGGLLVMVSWPEVPGFLLAQILGGIGYALAQGTDSALLRAQFADDEMTAYRRHEARSQSWVFIGMLLAGTSGSILFRYRPELPFLAAAGAALLAAAAMFMIPYRARTGATPASATPTSAAPEDENAAAGHHRFEQRFWAAFYVIIRATALSIFVAFLPYYFFLILKIDLYYFGLVLSLFTLAAFFSARQAGAIMAATGIRTATSLVLTLIIFSLALFGASPLFWPGSIVPGLAAITALGLAAGCVRPLTMSALNGIGLPAKTRSNAISRMERLYGVANAFAIVFGGWALSRYGFAALMIGFAVLSGIVTLFFLAAAARLQPSPARS